MAHDSLRLLERTCSTAELCSPYDSTSIRLQQPVRFVLRQAQLSHRQVSYLFSSHAQALQNPHPYTPIFANQAQQQMRCVDVSLVEASSLIRRQCNYFAGTGSESIVVARDGVVASDEENDSAPGGGELYPEALQHLCGYACTLTDQAE